MSDVAKSYPKMFISHRHADHRIAEILKNFVRMATAGKVKVFQSSYAGSGPKIGELLTENLGRELCQSELVLLVYTAADEHWAYCMWECGVAFDPRTASTRIAVLQCAESVPAPIDDRVRIKLKDKDSIKRFVIQLMTDKEFFPRYGDPITDFTPESPELSSIAEELYSDLQSVIIPHRPDESWPAWPFLLFEISLELAQKIESAVKSGQHEDARTVLRQHCIVRDGDFYAAHLFGMPGFDQNYTLASMISRWERNNPGRPALWAKVLQNQIIKAILWEFPEPEWTLFKNESQSSWHAPLLLKVCRSTMKGVMQFEVYFPKFNSFDEINKTVKFDLQ